MNSQNYFNQKIQASEPKPINQADTHKIRLWVFYASPPRSAGFSLFAPHRPPQPKAYAMTMVFLSYSTKDYFFAELAEIKLAEANIRLWRDKNQLPAGTDWRQGIERGISESVAILVALSPNSAESSYVTYEWAYALGSGKPIIPITLSPCPTHPKLETIQHLSFTNSTSLPWASLIERIREVETDSEPLAAGNTESRIYTQPDPDDVHVMAILAYLNQRGYQMASFDRIRRRIDDGLTDKRLLEIIEKNPTLLRKANLKDGAQGVAKLVP